MQSCRTRRTAVAWQLDLSSKAADTKNAKQKGTGTSLQPAKRRAAWRRARSQSPFVSSSKNRNGKKTLLLRFRTRMSILVVCQTCKTRFQVNEKFAGKQGPCPKCKAVITIPKLDEQVVIHAPEEYAGGGSVAAKDASGRAVLKPISREKPKLQPVTFVAAGAGVLVAVVVAFLLRGSQPNLWILAGGAFLLAPPRGLAGYFAMRDAESEPYRGAALWLRAGIVSVVYTGLWGVAALFSTMVYADAAPQIWQLIPPTAIMIVGGTIAALATLDLEPINAFFHYAFYLVVTVLLRVMIGLTPLGGGATATETTAAVWMGRRPSTHCRLEIDVRPKDSTDLEVHRTAHVEVVKRATSGGLADSAHRTRTGTASA